MISEQNEARPALKRLSVCLINPKFEVSFWGSDYSLPLYPGGKRYAYVTGSLPLLAALAPPHCEIELLDENVEPIDFTALRRFDVIGVTGMIVQAPRMKEILLQLKELPAMVIVGGAYMSVAEQWFDGLCDVRFVGEAEETWPEFLNALGAGEPVKARYEQAEKTNMATVPPPRYDLLKIDRYQMTTMQFSRGCPFMCEFCDIITVFGRRPRAKTVEQMLVELDTIKAAGFRTVFVVDDNFIGNKKLAKALLHAVIAWQKRNGYPLMLHTEASVNLADDQEMIDLMAEANFRQVFLGIETPRKESLAETRKVQNIMGDSMEAKVQRIRDGGLVVTAGFIVGFDNDDEAIFQEQYDFIQRSGIAQAAISILAPVPTTPLYARLKAEGRLDFADPEVIFRPRAMTREALKNGFSRLMQRLYTPEAYFERLFDGYRGSVSFRRRRAEIDARVYGPPSLAKQFRSVIGGLIQAAKLASALQRAGMLRRMGSAYLKVWFKLNLPIGRDAMPFAGVVGLCVVHWHFYNVSRMLRKNYFGTVEAVEVVEVKERVAVAG